MITGVALVGVVCCLLSQAFFSGSEMALIAADRASLRAKASQGHAGAALALRLLQREDTLLATCLIGTNLSVVAGTTLVATIMQWHGLGTGIAVALVFTPFALTLGENLPKTVFQYHANVLAPVLCWPLRLVQWFLTPALYVLGAWTQGMSHIMGTTSKKSITPAEIVDLLGEAATTEIMPEEQQVIRRVFALSDLTVETCMTPLVDVIAVQDNTPLSQAQQTAIQEGLSRVPVYFERVDNLVGVLDVHTLLSASDLRAPVRTLMTPAKFVPESKRVDDLLREMRQERDHLVIVVDEYGGSTGIVTLEDLLEQVIGEIRDEHDDEQPLVKRLTKDSWRVSARASVAQLTEELGIALPVGDYETVAGLILEHTGRVPQPGETVRVGQWAFLVEEGTPRAIATVTITLIPTHATP